MSDEPPPSLRLKPRLKPEGDPAGAADAASNPTPKADEGGMKIRLRPKLSADPEPEPAVEEPPSSPDDISTESEPLPEPEPMPEPEPPPPVPAASDGPKFRLKTRAADPAGQPAAATPATPFVPPSSPPDEDPNAASTMQFDPTSEMNIPIPSSPLYVPTVETPATESVRLDLSPAPPPVPLDDLDSEPVPPPVTPPPRRKLPVKAGTLSLIAAVVFILGCGAFFVHRVMTAPSTGRPVKQKSRIKSIPVVQDPTPTPMPTPTPLPVVEDPKPKSAVTNLVTTAIAPGISATSAGAVEAVNASPQFRSWVAAARISGVSQRAEPIALINGRAVRAGAIADEALGIVFESIDVEKKTILFKDRNGAEVSRRY